MKQPSPRILLIVIASLGLIMSCAHIPTPTTETCMASFGLMNETYDELTPTNWIPYQVGMRYGWILTVCSKKSKAEVKEVFKLPAGASWTTNPPPPPESGLKIIRQWQSKSGDLAINEFEMNLATNCFLIRPYRVIDGDPQGKYKISLFVDGRLVRKFTFQVTNAGRLTK